MPRLNRLLFVIIIAAGLLVACGGGTPSATIPTVTQLPTAPPTDIPPTIPPTEEIFFTPTPDESADIFATPTPLGDDSIPTTDDSPCGLTALEGALNELDADTLQADHDTFMAAFREAAAEVEGWTLSGEPDPLAGLATTNAVPVANLRYRRGENQEASILISPAPPALHAFYQTCIGMADYYRAVGSLTDDATLTIEPLAALPPGVLVTVVEPTEEGGATGISEFIIEAYTVPTGEILFEYTSIPAFDEIEGRDPVARADAEALLQALADIAAGL
ncbi:hypothetical protein ACFLYO_10245 [Chloroflexota bacterium]